MFGGMKIKMTSLRMAGLTVFLALSACVSNVSTLEAAPKQQSAGQEKVVIRNNKGGNVLQAIQRRNQLEQWGGPVEVRGYCGSACTLFITMKNACLGPGATVGFHAPRIPNTTYIPPGVDAIMGNYYRNGILARWNSRWKHSLKIEKISAKEYVALDPQTKLCR